MWLDSADFALDSAKCEFYAKNAESRWQILRIVQKFAESTQENIKNENKI